MTYFHTLTQTHFITVLLQIQILLKILGLWEGFKVKSLNLYFKQTY